MIPLRIPHYSGSNNSTPDRITEYRHNPKDQYKGEECVSITRSIQLKYKPEYDKENVFRVNKGHWSAFSKWIKEEVIKPGKTESSPLSLPGPNGPDTFSFNREERYKGGEFICIKKKTGSVRSSYENLAIAKDDWSEFSEWMKQVIEEKI